MSENTVEWGKVEKIIIAHPKLTILVGFMAIIGAFTLSILLVNHIIPLQGLPEGADTLLAILLAMGGFVFMLSLYVFASVVFHTNVQEA
jgi:hypothetical protein